MRKHWHSSTGSRKNYQGIESPYELSAATAKKKEKKKEEKSDDGF